MICKASEDGVKNKKPYLIGVDLSDFLQKTDDETVFLPISGKKQHSIEVVKRFVRKQLKVMSFKNIDCCTKLSKSKPKNCKYVGTIEELFLSRFTDLNLPI